MTNAEKATLWILLKGAKVLTQKHSGIFVPVSQILLNELEDYGTIGSYHRDLTVFVGAIVP